MRRERHNLFMLTFPSDPPPPPPRAAPVAHKVVWPRPGLNVDSVVWRQELNSLLFLKSQHPQPTLPDMTSFTSLVSFPIWEFYFDICEWTPALMLHLTNPCTKRKVLILTKPKGKIYKTKSLRHYITSGVLMWWWHSFLWHWSLESFKEINQNHFYS